MKILKALLLSVTMLQSVSLASYATTPIEIDSPVSMRVYLPDESKSTGRCVIAFPGGSYRHHAIDREGYDWAPFFNDMGIAYVVCRYRMPQGNPANSINDAETAIRMVRDSAEVWHINPVDVGIMGSSAGGHLASTVATHSRGDVRPDFQILFYPLISMEESITHKLSRRNFLGDNPSPELVAEYCNERHVTPDTPRCFMAFSCDDKAALPVHGAEYYRALVVNGVPASCHVYPGGGHGWGFLPSFRYHGEMRADLSAWLQSF